MTKTVEEAANIIGIQIGHILFDLKQVCEQNSLCSQCPISHVCDLVEKCVGAKLMEIRE